MTACRQGNDPGARAAGVGGANSARVTLDVAVGRALSAEVNAGRAMTAALRESAVEMNPGARSQQRLHVQMPRLASALVERRRLDDRLDRLAPLTVLHALRGFGKTTLVGAWARRRQAAGMTVLWTTLTSSAHSGDELSAILRESEDVRAVNVPHIIVIDDGHHLSERRSIDDLCTLLDQDPLLHIVVISRTRHPLIEAAERRRIEIEALTARELAAEPLELIEFARVWGHTIDEGDAGDLHGLVGGWISIAKLVLDARRSGEDIAVDEGARRMIRTMVLPDAGDASLLQIAGRLALAETITEKLADLLLGTSFATSGTIISAEASMRELIDRLECTGLLEPARSEGPMSWAFRAPVRRELAESFESRHPSEALELHRALAEHFAEHGEAQSLGAALLHARRGEDWEFLSRLFSQYALRLTFEFPTAAAAAYGNIPASVLDDVPSLAIPVALMNSLNGHPDDKERSILIRAYAAVGQRALSRMSSTTSIDDTVGTASAGIISLRSAGLLRESLDLGLRVESILSNRRTLGELEPAPVELAWFLMQSSVTSLLAGQSARAAELSVHAFGASSGVETAFVAANAAAQLALIHTLEGEPAQAERWLVAHDRFDVSGEWFAHLVMLPARIARVHRSLAGLDEEAASAALALAGDVGQPVEMWAFVTHAMVEHALLFGDPFVALARLRAISATRLGTSDSDSAARRIVDRCTVDLLLALGQLNRAQRHLAESPADSPWLDVPRARLQLIAGNEAAARDLATSSAWRSETSAGDRIELLLIAASAHLALGAPEDAAKAFTGAHTLAEQADTLSPYTRMAARVRAALFQLGGIELNPQAAELLTTARDVYPEAGELVVLTAREDVVLAQMILHDTIPAIAEALTLSVNTIKKQTVSIYAKLGVSDRASALARAHRIGLL